MSPPKKLSFSLSPARVKHKKPTQSNGDIFPGKHLVREGRLLQNSQFTAFQQTVSRSFSQNVTALWKQTHKLGCITGPVFFLIFEILIRIILSNWFILPSQKEAKFDINWNSFCLNLLLMELDLSDVSEWEEGGSDVKVYKSSKEK